MTDEKACIAHRSVRQQHVAHTFILLALLAVMSARPPEVNAQYLFQ